MKDSGMTRTSHLMFLFIVVMCAGFGYWAWQGELDIVSVADGQVIPTGKIRHIQHYEGGIVQRINVREGDEVTEGQPLMELEQVRSGASLEELQMRIDALRVDIIRHTAMIEDRDDPGFPREMETRHPHLVRHARDLLSAYRDSVLSQVEQLDNIVAQKRQRIQTITSDLENKRQRLPLLQEQLALSEELLADNLTTRYKHLEIMRHTKEIEGSIQNDMSALREAKHALQETEASRREVIFSHREKAVEQRKKAEQELDELSVRVKKFEDSMQKTVIRSPVNGIVKKLHMVTTGGVIKPGDIIADIVPSEEKLVIEAHLPISDIGYVQEGQAVFLMLPTADARKYGKLPATVVSISPDTFTDQNRRTFYNVLIESEHGYFQSGDQQHKLYPGMVVIAHIHIGTRTVLAYLLDPLMNTLSFSMQER